MPVAGWAGSRLASSWPRRASRAWAAPPAPRTRRRPAQLGPLLERLVRRTGGHAAPSSTLAELGSELARLVGPQTAALAAQAERARFAPDVSGPVAHPRIRVARAVVSDLGTVRALTLSVSLSMSRSMLALPSATQHERVT